MRITTAIIFLVAAILAIVVASADAGHGKGKRASRPVEQTLAEVTTTTVPDCPAWCAPLEPTLVPGTECDYVWNVCITDETGQPNCEGWTASCD